MTSIVDKEKDQEIERYAMWWLSGMKDEEDVRLKSTSANPRHELLQCDDNEKMNPPVPLSAKHPFVTSIW